MAGQFAEPEGGASYLRTGSDGYFVGARDFLFSGKKITPVRCFVTERWMNSADIRPRYEWAMFTSFHRPLGSRAW